MIGESARLHARTVSTKTWYGTGRPMPGHLREHDVGSARACELVQPFQGLLAEPVVVVAEEHVLALRGIDPHIAGLARPTRVLLVDDP